MKKHCILKLLLTLAVVCAISLVIYVFYGKLSLTDHERIQSLLNVFISFGGIISAIIIVYSYIQTNAAFILSQKPSLLVQVVSLHLQNAQNPQTKYPRTIILYRETKNNYFEDLTFRITVSTDYKTVDISDLFRPKMKMPGLDSRQRTFDPIGDIRQKGLDIVKESDSGNSVKLKIIYEFTFMNSTYKYEAQEYKWNNSIQEWEIY